MKKVVQIIRYILFVLMFLFMGMFLYYEDIFFIKYCCIFLLSFGFVWVIENELL